MRCVTVLTRLTARWALAVVALGGLLPAVLAQKAGPADPVDELREALQVPKRFSLDPVELNAQLNSRREFLESRVKQLRTIGEMRRALELQGWKDEDLNPGVADVDWPIRDGLANRLEDALRRVLRNPNSTGRLAAIALIDEMDSTVRGPGIHSRLVNRYDSERSTRPLWEVMGRIGGALSTSDLAPFEAIPFLMLEREMPNGIEGPNGFARRFTADLVQVIRDGTPSERTAAARALGRINPEPFLAAPTLGAMLSDPDPVIRRAAAQGLLNLMREVAQLAKKGRTATAVETSRSDVVYAGRAVVPQAASGLNDADADVSRLCLEAIGAAANALVEPGVLVANPTPREEFPPDGWRVSLEELITIELYRSGVEEERAEVLPLAEALNAYAPAVARALADSRAAVRLQAALALGEMGIAQQKLIRRQESVPRLEAGIVVSAEKAPPVDVPDPFQSGLQAARGPLAAALTDSDMRVRLAVVESLQMIHGDLGPACDAVIRALSDPDRFVRWAAARTLRKVNTTEMPRATRALARLLCDPDLGVRLTVTDTLERFGPEAADAVPALTAAVGRGDPEFRIGCIEALVAIGPAAASAVPAIADQLSHGDARVRRSAAEGLGKFGLAARPAAAALRRALQDSDEQVRRLASDALLNFEP